MAGLGNKQTIWDNPQDKSSESSLDEWAKSPERGGQLRLHTQDDQSYVEKAVSGILNGQIGYEGAMNLAKRVKGIAPHVFSALEQRKSILKTQSEFAPFFQLGVPEQQSTPGMGYGPPELSGQNAGVFPASGDRPAVPAKSDWEGAINKAMSSLNYDLAGKIAVMREKAQGSGRDGYYTPQADEQGIPWSYDHRTGKWIKPNQGEAPKLAKWSPTLNKDLEAAKSEGKETGKAEGEQINLLNDMNANMPRLEKVVADLSRLGKAATYTKSGQIIDTTKRQLGQPVGEGAVARKEYSAKLNNEIIPLLRSTFGPQFTEKDRESLVQTLGDPDASPEEKDAVLSAFIATKRAQVHSLKRRTGKTDGSKSNQPANNKSDPLGIR